MSVITRYTWRFGSIDRGVAASDGAVHEGLRGSARPLDAHRKSEFIVRVLGHVQQRDGECAYPQHGDFRQRQSGEHPRAECCAGGTLPDHALRGVVDETVRVAMTPGAEMSAGGMATAIAGEMFGKVMSTVLRPLAAGAKRAFSKAVRGTTKGVDEALEGLGRHTIEPLNPRVATGAPGGRAILMQHPRQPTHVTVSVEGGAHTHQVITGPKSTRIFTTQVEDAGAVLRQVDVPLDAARAAGKQAELLRARNLGPYGKVTNSCIAHVCEVLEAGGVSVPSAIGSAQVKHITSLKGPRRLE